jgi:hypothetical protein
VWFKQNLERVDEHGMASFYSDAAAFEASTADKVACEELAMLNKLHPDKLAIEPVNGK